MVNLSHMVHTLFSGRQYNSQYHFRQASKTTYWPKCQFTIVLFACRLQEECVSLLYTPEKLGKTDNYMDKWILSFTQSLIKFVRQEMQGNYQQDKFVFITND